jgi:hypothetical protein
MAYNENVRYYYFLELERQISFGFYWCEKIKDSAPEERKIHEFNLCFEMDED